jgi:FAD/FMN-containing dehydrogenase
MEAALADLQAQIRAATAVRSPLVIRGGGTKDFYGQAVAGTVLDVTPYAGIVDYDPTELVITARAGTPLADMEQALRTSGQMLPCEPPHFGARATLGGAVAAGLSGPRRPYAGALRDIVLGVRVLDGRGEDLAFGGRVMKNVAGFDLARVMTGALGTLGVLTEISLKCVPLPKFETTRVLECSVGEAIRLTNEWSGKPLPVSATCHHAGRLAVRLSGAAPAIRSAERSSTPAMPSGRAFASRPRRTSPRRARMARRSGDFPSSRRHRTRISAANSWSNGAVHCAGWLRTSVRKPRRCATGRATRAVTRRCFAPRTSPPARFIRCPTRCTRCTAA